MAILWFYWIGLSLEHYGYSWGLPVGIFLVSLGYGILFYIFAYISNFLSDKTSLPSLLFKALFLLGFSYIHPFGFDWFKPELMFVESYIGIQKWQFAIVLFALILSIWKKNLLFISLILFAYQPTASSTIPSNTSHANHIQIVTTHTTVEDKWNKTLHTKQFKKLFSIIDQAIDANKTLIILPESVFPVFINRSQTLVDTLQEKAKHINIVTGGLYLDGEIPRNSTYIFTSNKITVANKVVLVPFGESNPLPDFLSDWVNRVFYDNAVDYKASSNVVDYQIEGITYRNAICFEATSEKLYTKDKKGHYPKNMIVLSNNGWFTPSIEPTLQKLLLQYYSKKYGTTIYHSVNMSQSYKIQNGNVLTY